MCPKTSTSKPLIYSCSGCSNVAQLANDIAVTLDREGNYEMSCIAGLGGDVKPLVKKAKSASNIIAIDGCKLACARHTLARHNIIATKHIDLSELGFKKRKHTNFSSADSMLALKNVHKMLGLDAQQ